MSNNVSIVLYLITVHNKHSKYFLQDIFLSVPASKDGKYEGDQTIVLIIEKILIKTYNTRRRQPNLSENL